MATTILQQSWPPFPRQLGWDVFGLAIFGYQLDQGTLGWTIVAGNPGIKQPENIVPVNVLWTYTC